MDETVGQMFRAGELWRRRTDRGWSISQLARESGLSFGYLAKVERQEAEPSPGAIVKVAMALGCGVEELTFPDEPEADDADIEALFQPETTARYDAGRVYRRSTDDNGNKTSLTVTVPATLAARIAVVVASRQIPAYRTGADFLRDAVYHRLHWIEQMIADGGVSNEIRLEIGLAEIDAVRSEMETMAQTLETYRALLRGAVKQGDRDALTTALDHLDETLPTLREPYRSGLRRVRADYLAEIKQTAVR